MTHDPISHYHDLLSRGDLAAESQGLLDELQRARGLSFGPRPLCTVLRPRFLTVEQYRYIRKCVGSLTPALRAIYQRGLADAEFRRQFRLHDWEEQLLEIDPGFAEPSPTSRLDSFFDGEAGLRFTEFNTETPAGAGYTDAIGSLFYSLPAMQEFQKTYQLYPAPCMPGVLHALQSSYAEWQRSTGNRDTPRVAILDWREVPTFSEFVLFYDYFRSVGLEARNVDPRECEFLDGKLMCGDYHITLIYKRVLISELVTRGGIDHPVIRAVRAGAVCMANSFRCKMLFKKASFAVLSDERNAHLFTPAELAAIEAHIPWTRVVESRNTTVRGRPVDLVEYINGNRRNLVLKPNDDYGGTGIVLGWTVDQPGWEAAVARALAAPFVVQEKIALPREPYPAYYNGALHVAERMVDTNPYLAPGGAVSGCLTRISSDELVNVTAGGGSTVPTYLIDTQ